MTAPHMKVQLQSFISSIPVCVTLESLIESQWPSVADKGMIFFVVFVVLGGIVVFVCITRKVSRCLRCAHTKVTTRLIYTVSLSVTLFVLCSHEGDCYTQPGTSTH